ncbi:MAG: hypothetical protein N2255_03190 [Kiritimatiellae bacterium]|nr:hypothetical protein [Kiritimatiellia bacterium]
MTQTGSLLQTSTQPDWVSFRDCILRKGTPRRVHYIELFLDPELAETLVELFDLADCLDRNDPFFDLRKHLRLQRFLGYDYVTCGFDEIPMPLRRTAIPDTAALARKTGRSFVDEKVGPITTWSEFETYPWPDPSRLTTRKLEWYERNLPDDMCVLFFGIAHFAEYLTWLMGYETLCYALYEQRDLVRAIAERLEALYKSCLEIALQFERVRIVWGSDDMGFRSGPLIAPTDLREFVFPGHKKMAEMCHKAGRPYILHSCGNLEVIMEELIRYVGIDGKHSFEDTIEDVRIAKRKYGNRTALLGGIDVDFLCRASESEIRRRVRDTLDVCLPGGGYCLGTGNSVANYIPVRSYLVMLDEGRRYSIG